MRLVKLSTAAAVAASLATSASAVELSEAIKGVDVSGYVRYRMENIRGDINDVADDAIEANNQHRYKYRFGFTMPVNDDVSANLLFGNLNTQGGVLAGGDGEAYLDDTFYGNGNFGIAHAYFTYQGVENLTVMAGKQPMPTPFNDDEHGNGLVAMYNAGPVTVAGGYFDSSNASANLTASSANNLNTQDPTVVMPGDNIAALGVMGSVEMVNFSAWYADHQNLFSAYTVDVNADIMDMVNVGARHTALKYDNEVETAVDNLGLATTDGSDKKNSLTKVYADADIDMFNVRATYARTGSEGGTVNYDSDAETGFVLEYSDLSDMENARAFHVGAGMTVGKITAGVDYVRGKYDNTDSDNALTTGVIAGTETEGKFTELMPTVSYAMSDNFEVSALYSRFKMKDTENSAGNDLDDTKNKITRLQAIYTF